MNRTRFWHGALGGAVLAALVAGCDTSRPDAGLTNGPAPGALRSGEKPAIRDDLPEPPATAGEAARADSSAASTGGTGTQAGTGGGGGGPGARPAPAGTSDEPRGTPPTKDASGEGGAQGGTKPAGNINTGNPRSPQ